jgi:tetratricopeptide (TPR) repeat protein
VHKRTQKWTVVFIIAALCISLIGTSFVAIFQPGQDQSADELNNAALENEYIVRKEKVEELNQKLENNPDDTEVIIQLADAYYEKSYVTSQLNVNEYQQDLKNAMELYQKVSVDHEDAELMLKLATTAFYYGESTVAEQTFQDLLKREPENVDALYGYGVFLLYDKGDHQKAKENWEKAITLTTDEKVRDTLNEMIALADSMDINIPETAKQ